MRDSNNVKKRLTEAKGLVDFLNLTLSRLEIEMSKENENDTKQICSTERNETNTIMDSSNPFTIRANNDGRLWRTDRKNGLTAEVLCKRHEDFQWLFNVVFDEDFGTDSRLSLRELSNAVYSLYNKNEFVRDICDKYCLNQTSSLGYRAWITYLTARSSFLRMENGTEYIYGLRIKQIEISDDECQDGNLNEEDEKQFQKDLKSGRLMDMNDFLKQ